MTSAERRQSEQRARARLLWGVRAVLGIVAVILIANNRVGTAILPMFLLGISSLATRKKRGRPQLDPALRAAEANRRDAERRQQQRNKQGRTSAAGPDNQVNPNLATTSAVSEPADRGQGSDVGGPTGRPDRGYLSGPTQTAGPTQNDTPPGVDAQSRIDDAPVREVTRTNEEMLARSQESIDELRERIGAEAQVARDHAAQALAATVSAAGIQNSQLPTPVDGDKIRETASSLPPLSGSGAARAMPWETPLIPAATTAAGGIAGLADRFAEELLGENGIEVFRNVRLSSFGDKSPLVVVKGDRAVIIDVLDLPTELLSWAREQGRAILTAGTSRSDKPGRIAETITDWSRDNPDADFASVLTLESASPGSVTGEPVETVNLLDAQDVVGTVLDWLADADSDAAVTEKLNGYLKSRANRF